MSIYLQGVPMPCRDEIQLTIYPDGRVRYSHTNNYKGRAIEIPDNGFVSVPKKGGTENEKEELG